MEKEIKSLDHQNDWSIRSGEKFGAVTKNYRFKFKTSGIINRP